MSFCGQCGFQLAPDDTRCARCGAVVEPEEATFSSPGYAPDGATIQAASYLTGRGEQYESQATQGPSNGVSQQKLVLGPGGYGYDTPDANEATSMMNAPAYPAAPQVPEGSYPGYPVQNGLPPQPTAYPGYPAVGADYEGQYQAAAPRRKSPRTTGLVFILLGILLILGALVLFALQHNGILNTNSPGTTASQSVSTPTEQAEAVIQLYYASVSKRDYATAYHLWKNNTQKFSDFENGYRYTQSASVTFGNAQIRTNNQIYLPVTVTATEIVAATKATRQSVYTGYYLVEKQADGSWLIFDGDLK